MNATGVRERSKTAPFVTNLKVPTVLVVIREGDWVLYSPAANLRSLRQAETTMPICHEHNLAKPLPKQLPFGFRVKTRSTDPFKNLVGSDWSKEHWFATREERDRAIKEMGGRYIYFRPGDAPTVEFEKIER